MFEVKVRRRGDRVVIALAGELDCVEEHHCIKVLESVPHDLRTKLVFDLSAITFMDSTGLKVLLLADRRARTKGLRRPVIRGATPQVMRLLNRAGVTALLNMETRPDGGPARAWPGSAEHPSMWGNRMATS